MCQRHPVAEQEPLYDSHHIILHAVVGMTVKPSDAIMSNVSVCSLSACLSVCQKVVDDFVKDVDRLLPGWVTVSKFDSRGRHFLSVCNQPPRSTQPSTLRGTVK